MRCSRLYQDFGKADITETAGVPYREERPPFDDAQAAWLFEGLCRVIKK
ncbi:MAG: hypothetical protein LUI12_06810 [Clostridiales bacterium]|nr:hypothetical protein [Clostridiales bacterium]